MSTLTELDGKIIDECHYSSLDETRSKEIVNITIDPDLETADVDTSNNSFPTKQDSKFGKFKNKIKG